MCDRKSEASQKVYSIVHGKPSRDGPPNPSMFEILSWASPEQPCTHHLQPHVLEQPNRSHSMVVEKGRSVQKPTNMRQTHHICVHQACGNKDTAQSKPEYPAIENTAKHRLKHEQEPLANTHNFHDYLGKKKPLKPHEIKEQLYMYEEVHLKRSQSQNLPQSPKQQTERVPVSKPSPRNLDENDEKDRQIIDQRKKKIKEFNRLTRDLPNSAFTTYYGKPAFEAYGRGSSHAGKRTHNVMPQRGQNNPANQQCYTSALLHGKKIKNEIYVPRKPIENNYVQQRYQTEQSQRIHLPLQKPDLVNHIRFTQVDSKLAKKASVPSLANTLKKQVNKKYTFKTEKPRKMRKTKSKQVHKDGLKYMNERQDLIKLFEAKKVKESRLAYKVTECYPEGWPHVEEAEGGENVAAGKKYPKSDSAKMIIYRMD